MTWIHRVIEHRLSPERRRGLENRVGDRRLHAAADDDKANRRKTERRNARDRRARTGRRRKS